MRAYQAKFHKNVWVPDGNRTHNLSQYIYMYCWAALNFHLQYYSVVFPLQWTLTKADTFGIKFGVRLRESFIIVNQGCSTYGPRANVRPATRFYVARQPVYN